MKTKHGLATDKTQNEGIENLKSNKRDIFYGKDFKTHEMRKSKNGSDKHTGYILASHLIDQEALKSLAKDQLLQNRSKEQEMPF